jgi:hypothetical protein
MSNVTAIEQRPQLAVGARPSAIVPQTMDEAYRLGKAICMAGMAPKGMDTPEKCMIAIMRGMEVGLTPMMALDKIAVVNGRPTIWGDGAIGLVRGSGLCEWVRERVEGDGDARTAVCEAKRRGEPEPVVRRFSVSDAKRAGLWGKQGPWQQFPDRMLQMRARAFTLRDGFADVLGGLYLREELDSGEDRREPIAPPVPPVPQIQSQPPVIEHVPPEPPIPEPPTPPVKREAPIIGKLRDACDAAVAAKDVDALLAAWDSIVEPHITSNALTADLYEALSAVYQAAEGAFEK